MVKSTGLDCYRRTLASQVIRYASERINNWRDLRNTTIQADLTETVAIEILQDNKRMEFYVQCDPLGIHMTSVSVAP